MMADDNTDRGTVLITGPTRGLGWALALELARRPEHDRLTSYWSAVPATP